LGYEGVSLTAFVKERTDEDRDQRIAEREMKKAENAEKIKQHEIEALHIEKGKERQFELNKLKLIEEQQLDEREFSRKLNVFKLISRYVNRN
jgi:hypothetical protein